MWSMNGYLEWIESDQLTILNTCRLLLTVLKDFQKVIMFSIFEVIIIIIIIII